MSKFMGDTVDMPSQGGKMITSLKSEIHDIVKMLHEPYDSIKRTVWNAVPLKSTAFTRSLLLSKKTVYKNGTSKA